MGSEKYPDENYFDAFLKNFGGASNAFTDVERVGIYSISLNVYVFCTILNIFRNSLNIVNLFL